MTDTQRCEPPEHMRGVDGWHWVTHERWGEWPTRYLAPNHLDIGPLWVCPDSNWTPPAAHREGWRYLAPAPPPSTVAALVEALRDARLQLEYLESRWPTGTTPPVLVRVNAALALYRGEVA